MTVYSQRNHAYMSLKNCSIDGLSLGQHPACSICTILLGEGHECSETFFWSKSYWIYNEYPEEKVAIMQKVGISEYGVAIDDDNAYEQLPEISAVLPKYLYNQLTLGWTMRRKRVNTTHMKLPVCSGCYAELKSGKRDAVFNRVYANLHKHKKSHVSNKKLVQVHNAPTT